MYAIAQSLSANGIRVTDADLDDTLECTVHYSDVVAALECGEDELARIWLDMLGGVK